MKEEKYIAVAVIDCSNGTLTICDFQIGLELSENYQSEDIESQLIDLGYKMSNCSWGVFDGTIHDLRNTDDLI